MVIKFIKKTVIKILSFLNLEISYSYLSFDDIYGKFLDGRIIILDVGANDGRSIKRFKKIFPKSEIHSFEPLISQKITLRNIQENFSDIVINNFALGNKKEKGKLIINTKDDTSSFLKLDLNSEWVKKRSQEYKVNKEDFMRSVQEVEIETLDNYLENNNIEYISILKIDVQGFEEEVLEGGKSSLKNNLFEFIEVEIILSNVYERKQSFLNIEKHLIPNNYELVAINKSGFNNIYEGYIFQFDLLYKLSKKI